MKKIPKSIMVTVRNGGNFRATGPGHSWTGGGMDMERVRLAFPKTPLPPYKVTYTVRPCGKYLVIKGPFDSAAKLTVKDDESWADTHGTYVCFLEPFIGLRVSRRVEALLTTRHKWSRYPGDRSGLKDLSNIDPVDRCDECNEAIGEKEDMHEYGNDFICRACFERHLDEAEAAFFSDC